MKTSNQIAEILESSIENNIKSKEFSKFDCPEILVQKPKIDSHGTWSSNIALSLSRILRKDPMIIAEIIKKTNLDIEDTNLVEDPNYILQIKNVIQSPFWDEEQIPSIYLKNSLIDQNNYTNSTELSFDYLYETSLRYKLAWDTWFREMGLDAR